MVTTTSGLYELIYRFYPRGVRNIQREYVPLGESVYDDTEEHFRLVEAANRGRTDYLTWKAMVRRLGDLYSLQNESLHLLSGGADPAYSARIWLDDDKALSFHVSLLGPFYGIHLPGMPGEDTITRNVIREIESTYPGCQTILPEIGNAPVPDVYATLAFGKETIYTCLFSEVWTWVE